MRTADNIFFIPVGDLIDRKPSDYYMVYSPLAGTMLLMKAADADRLKACLDGEDGIVEPLSPELRDIADALTDCEPIDSRSDQIRSCRDFVTLYVLPNYACNFSCSYCFAAQGRDRQRLEPAYLLSMIEWMLNPARTRERRIYITFLGGGEPALSFDVMRQGIEYGNRLARGRGFEMEWSIVTNGSLVSDDMLDFFKRENVTVRYSFEIIPEIQRQQRGDFDSVDRSIRSACAKGMSPVIRAMITPRNVSMLEEMVRIIDREYNGVRLLKIDPITDASFGDDLQAMEKFYQTYNDEFLKAKALGESLGIDVQCATTRNLDSVISRFCAGEIALNGYGEITACHRVSSPREAGYEDMKYGYVDAEGVHIDEEKFLRITSDKVDTKTLCADCFLKYNCAGGCHAQNEQYTDGMQRIVCHYSRELSRRQLFERLCSQLCEGTDMTIQQLIQSEEEDKQ